MSNSFPSGSVDRVAAWAKDAGALLLTIVTVLLYLALRLPTSIFLARLGSSPEEVGLGYTDLLLQSSMGVAVAVLVVLGGAVVLASIVAPLIIGERLFSTLRLQGKNRGNVEKMSDQDFEKFVAFLRDVVGPRLPELFEATGLTIDETIRRITRRRELAQTVNPTSQDADELKALKRGFERSFYFRWIALLSKSAIQRSIRQMAFASLAIVTFAALPVFASIEAGRVQDGKAPSLLAEQLFGYSAEPVEVQTASTTPAPEVQRLATRSGLFLLGATSTAVVLYDSDSRRTIRVPAAGVIVTSRT